MSQSSDSTLLIADIGGTNARFALANLQYGDPLIDASITSLSVAKYRSFEQAASHYLEQTGARPAQAVLAFASPIRNGVAQATNSSWQIDQQHVGRALSIPQTALINDFAAQSLSLSLLDSRTRKPVGPVPWVTINPDEKQTYTIIGPGTGLGVSALKCTRGHLQAVTTEGGHTGFAPDNAEEMALLRYLLIRDGRVSRERLLSGFGLVNLYQAMAAIEGVDAPAETAEAITHAASKDKDDLCIRTLTSFWGMLGSAAGDAVLHLGGWQGACIAGGLPHHLLPWLDEAVFRTRFEAKGRFTDLMKTVPTAIITHAHPGLLGCIVYAQTFFRDN